jgi:hypothetical protein
MVNAGIQPWLFEVKPYPAESLSHYLGRFRRANHLTVSALGVATGLGGIFIKRLEHFHLNPFPTAKQIADLAGYMGISPEAVLGMLPPHGVPIKLEPSRLCAACYAEVPYHRLAWQYKQTSGCEKHRLRLLSECPKCKKRFGIPALWHGACNRCGMTFEAMQIMQKSF